MRLTIEIIVKKCDSTPLLYNDCRSPSLIAMSMTTVPQKNYLYSKITIALLFGLPSLSLASPIACQISPLAQYITQDQQKNKAELYASSDDGYLTPTEGEIIGNAQVFLGDDELMSEGFHLDRINNVVTSTGKNVIYATPTAVLEGKEGVHYIDQSETIFKQASYYIKGLSPIQGRATRIDHKELQQNTLLQDATYSTCAVDNEIWKVKSRDLEIDHTAGRAIAKNATLDIIGLPILYTPYISFPIDNKRHSGLLTPEISISKSDGFELFLPYYFNLAPNMDAILAPGFIEKRGAAVKGNFRYLNKWQELELSGLLLFNDKLYDNKNRWFYKFDQKFNFNKNLTGNLLYQDISDDSFQEDVNDQSGLLRELTLDREAVLNYRTPNWVAKIRFQEFVVTDPKIIQYSPYGRAPQLLFHGSWDLKGFDVGLDAEFSHFFSKDNDNLKQKPIKSANRIDIMPYISYRLGNPWSFFETTARFRYTHYNLNYHDNEGEGKETSITRALPILSARTGLVLEKELALTHLFGGGDFIQTIEPELFYLYAPYRKQSNIPIFDTSPTSLNFFNLFSYNAFYGADRQSNANQVTMALTTRLFHSKTGAERFVFSLGQTRYFDPPRIQIGSDLEHSDLKKSALNARVEVTIIPGLKVDSNMQWSPTDKRISNATLNLKYNPESRKIFNINYRYNRWGENNKSDYIDTSGFWQLDQKWAVAGRYNYSITESKMIESLIGVEYKDCCVATRVGARYFRNNVTDTEKQWKVYLEFELDSIGSVGQNNQKLWADNISGFTVPKVRRY